MIERCENCLSHLKKSGVEYGDARVVDQRHEQINVRGNTVENVADRSSKGIGVRVLHNGAWGFAATADLSDSGLAKCSADALEVAKASAMTITERAILAEKPVEQGDWKSPRVIDPFEVPLTEKIEHLISASSSMASHPKIVSAKGHVNFIHEKKFYADTEGSRLHQDILHTGGAIEAVAREGDQVQKRSFPNSHDGDWAAAGWEWIENLKMPSNAEQVAQETADLLHAPECPSGEIDLILAGPQLALQIHESCGHPTELDRALGTEISLAGASFMTPDRLGKLKYGSDKVNLFGDARIAGTLGGFAWDDEGVPAQRFDIVQNGLFVGYQTSRETAAQLGQTSNGTMRADGWARAPLIRMTNINLAPDPDGPTLEELIEDTKYGILLDVNKSWSIDDLRLNFSFGCEYGILIENGERAGLVKNPVYVGITPKFWGSCDAVCNEENWKVWGVANCGKGHPQQRARVGHGVSGARFRSVTVGRSQ
jgi:TldD protein